MRELINHPSFREGFRVSLGASVAAFVIGISFGVLAEPIMGPVAPVVMSAIVFAGSAQFGALAVLAAGGGAAAAVIAGVLLNARYLPMGIALAPSLSGGPLRRALIGQAMVDFSWAAAAGEGGKFDWRKMVGSTVPSIHPGSVEPSSVFWSGTRSGTRKHSASTSSSPPSSSGS